MFHVRHVARPNYVKDILHVLANEYSESVEALHYKARELGLSVGTGINSLQSFRENPLQAARDIGLIEENSLTLTEKGSLLHQLVLKNESVADNILHFFCYERWHEDQPEEHCFSWTYRRLVDEFWDNPRVAIDKRRLAIMLANRAQEEFSSQFGLSPQVSLSDSSVKGVLNWLEILEPPCLQIIDGEMIFIRRNFCPPELMILAIDYLYRVRRADYGTNLFFTEANVQTLCKACLLERDIFETVLEWTIGQFDNLVEGGGGGWDRGITLYQKTTLTGLLQ
jgi:hypothetical protein